MFDSLSIRPVMSRRATLAGLGAGGVGIALATLPRATSGQDATPAPGMHPIVGSWLVDTLTGDPRNPPALFLCAADGTCAQSDLDGTDAYGAWQATGESTADMTLVFLERDEQGSFAGTTKIRGNVDVAAGGGSFTARATVQRIDRYNIGSGEYGPVPASGTRIVPEAMGTPQGTIYDLAAMEAATPCAGSGG